MRNISSSPAQPRGVFDTKDSVAPTHDGNFRGIERARVPTDRA